MDPATNLEITASEASPQVTRQFQLPMLSAKEVAEAAAEAKRIHAEHWLHARHGGEEHNAVLRGWRREALLAARSLMRETDGLTSLHLVQSAGARRAMRYLPDIPISDDDLALQTSCLADGAVASSSVAEREAHVIERLLHGSTDPLLRARRDQQPRRLTRSQQNSISRSMVRQILAQRISTESRSSLAGEQEARVRGVMEQVGLRPRTLTTPLRHASDLRPGEFTPKETKITTESGSSKADCVARPAPAVIAPVECKYSSSALNGHKRLVKEVGDKAGEWRRALGDVEVCPVAVIGGVFDPRDVLTAQDKGVFVVWDHDLEPLGLFLLELLESTNGTEFDKLGNQVSLF